MGVDEAASRMIGCQPCKDPPRGQFGIFRWFSRPNKHHTCRFVVALAQQIGKLDLVSSSSKDSQG